MQYVQLRSSRTQKGEDLQKEHRKADHEDAQTPRGPTLLCTYYRLEDLFRILRIVGMNRMRLCRKHHRRAAKDYEPEQNRRREEDCE